MVTVITRENTIPQCAILKVIKPFEGRRPGSRGKPMLAKEGDLFWNVTPSHAQMRDGQAGLARKGKNMADAYIFTLEMIQEYFAVVS